MKQLKMPEWLAIELGRTARLDQDWRKAREMRTAIARALGERRRQGLSAGQVEDDLTGWCLELVLAETRQRQQVADQQDGARPPLPRELSRLLGRLVAAGWIIGLLVALLAAWHAGGLVVQLVMGGA